MEFFETDVWLPVDRHMMEVTTETPRAPTVFEWAAANIVAHFRESPEFAAASVGDVFRTALGVEGTDGFVRSAMDELFSATTNVLATDNHEVIPQNLPISSIRLTDDGERLLETGALPSEPKREHREVVYDPVAHRLMKHDVKCEPLPPDAAALEVATEDPLPPIDVVRVREEAHVKEGTRVGRIEPIGSGCRLWRRQRVGFSWKNGQVKLDRSAFGLASETADLLEALSFDRARALFFERSFATEEEFPCAVSSMPQDGIVRVVAPAAERARTPQGAKLVLRGVGNETGGFVASGLEIVSGETHSLVWMEDGLARMTIPRDELIMPEGAVSDGKRMIRALRIRVFFKDQPIELPVIVETELNAAEQGTLTEKVNRLIEMIPAADRVRVQFYLAENHEQRKQAVSAIVLATAGEERVAAIKALFDDLHEREKTVRVDLHAAVDGVFGMPGLAGFADVGEAQALADALPLRDEEIRWTKQALRRYREGRGTVGENPENDLVWIETSSKARPHKGGKHHGKNKHKRR